MSDIILYGLPPSTYVRTAMMVLALKGVPYAFQTVDFRAPDYAELHPFHRIPAFRHDEVHLFEALAITTYIDEVFDGPALTPADPVGKARMMQWISAVNDYVYDTVIGKCVNERFVKPMRGQTPDEAVIAAAAVEIDTVLGIFDAALANRDYLAGDALSIADCFLTPILVYFAATPEGGTILPKRENLTGWLDRMKRSEGFDSINAFG